MANNIIEYKYVIIHHSGVIPSDDDLTGEKQWQSICKNHQKNFKRKYPDSKAPYHYGIGRDGLVLKGEDEEKFCIHAGDDYINFRSLAVCFIGNFEIETMNENQLSSGVSLVRDLIKKYEISPEMVLRHNDIVVTQCPGKNFPWIRFSNKLVGIPQYKYDSIEYALKVGWIKKMHSPDESVDLGLLLTILKNFYEGIKNGN